MPLGSLIPPIEYEGLIAAEKAISVSNVVNGTTRLQPCVILIGQAAGTLAALTSLSGYHHPIKVPVRKVQEILLQQKAYLMPYADVPVGDPAFQSIQRVGASGFLRGKGQPNAWANRTWFEPDSTLREYQFISELPLIEKTISTVSNSFSTLLSKQLSSLRQDELLSIAQSIYWTSELKKYFKLKGYKDSVESLDQVSIEELVQKNWSNWGLSNFDEKRAIKKRELAVLLDRTINPFYFAQIDHFGNFISP